MNKNQAFPWDHPRFRSWISVARACQLMQQTLTRALAPLDIKPPHLDILINLYRFEGISQQELARKLLVGRSNMSMLLPQMEKRGLLERNADQRDKRVLRLSLTADGRTLTEKAMAIQTELIEQMLSATPIEECTRMAETMERLIQRMMAVDAGHEDASDVGLSADRG
ncbi:MarR family winged helix-turn-helix transcriptional regulator [Rhizobium wuzhouense]|uniref:MarR family transcriptional regulator n=1 Tax=Rhizobium wuzhouense TaxID=1986026 RepID=A0ABX5NTF8_9HYPH|nr:MarR family transcriptional regulator [Rhizobium wuzhouense]PYB75278.1 MarR family transcriptional regulator [Rhizobium wuzhouense]